MAYLYDVYTYRRCLPGRWSKFDEDQWIPDVPALVDAYRKSRRAGMSSAALTDTGAYDRAVTYSYRILAGLLGKPNVHPRHDSERQVSSAMREMRGLE